MQNKKNISYNEFHISKAVRDLCGISESFFSSSGNVIIRDFKSIQLFAEKLNKIFDSQGKSEKRVSVGNINAMGLLDEISHVVCMLYRKKKSPQTFSNALAQLDKKFGKENTDRLLLSFMEDFPPTEVYKGKISPEEFLSEQAIDSGTGFTRTNRETVLEEMILLHLANENPAFKPFKILFDDAKLQLSSIYDDAWIELQNFFKKQPAFGPFDNDLISMLKEPVEFSPNDLSGQLEYIRKNWMSIFPELQEMMSLFWASIDLLSEENKARWQPVNGNGQLPDMQSYSYENLMNEYEKFTPDKDWMPKVILMAKTVLVWLFQLTQKYGRNISTLDQIPDEELDTLAQQGFTGLWLIGLWERSPASKRIKQICGNPEAAASAYSLYDYEIAQNIGGWAAVENLRSRLWQRGIRLASDMVPNHTGMDSRWVVEKPDLFIQRRDNPFPQYTYNGENLSHDSRVSIFLEDHYYSKNDCAVVFKRVDNYTGDTRYIYHGNDGTGMPWNDTAQIDFLNPKAREEVIQEILHVARNFPIIRFDAAMVLAKKHIRRLWYPEPGRGGDIATRSQTQLSTKQFDDAIPNEFWREVVDRIAQEAPDTLLLAEAFWMLEGYFVRTLGMHRVYNSAFMNMLKKEENQKYKDSIKNTLNFDPQVLKRFVNFMNNPDEESAVAQFGKGDKYFGVCTLMVTMPGLPMFGHGQIEGFEEKYGMEYTRSYKNESPDSGLLERHKHQIFPLMKKRWLYANIENFLLFDVWENGHVNENVFAYSNAAGNEKSIVLYNNSYERAFGTIHTSATYAVKTGNGNETKLITRTLGQGIGASDFENCFILFKNLVNGLWYIRRSSEICRNGLFISLNGYETQVLQEIYEVTDDSSNKWSRLCENLAGKGVENLEIAWLELEYAQLYKALQQFLTVPCIQKMQKFLRPAPVQSVTKAKKAEKTFKPSAKNLKALLEEIEPSALEFFRQCAIFAAKEEKAMQFAGASGQNQKKTKKKIPAELLSQKEFKSFASQLKLLTTLAVSPSAIKKSKQEIPALLKKNIAETPELLDIFLIIKAFGSWAGSGHAEKWMLGKKALEQFHAAGIYSEFAAQNLERSIKLLPACNIPDANPGKIADLLFLSKNSAFLCGVNQFNNILWFNKEKTDDTLKLLELLENFSNFCITKGKKEKFAEKIKPVTSSLKKLEKVISAAEYNVANIMEKFSPVKKASATSAKTSGKAGKSGKVVKTKTGSRKNKS